VRFFARRWRERDGPAHLKDHLRDGFAQSRDLVVVLLKVFRNVASLWIADVDVQQRGAGVEAIHGGLDLLIPGDRELLLGGAILGHPHRPIGRGRDHQRRHVLGQQRIVGEVHRDLQWW
jgi:hypothetical protein